MGDPNPGNGGVVFENITGITEPQKGTTGSPIFSDVSNRLHVTNFVGLGGAAATTLANFAYYTFNNEPNVGGDGGDAIYIKHGTVLPRIYIVNKKVDALPTRAQDGILLSGGAGGGGGMGYSAMGTSSTLAKGADGARAGMHGNAAKGQPGFPASTPQNELVQFQGGNAGYIVGGESSGIYPGKVYIINESRNFVEGRHPSLPVVKGEVGFSVGHGENKYYE